VYKRRIKIFLGIIVLVFAGLLSRLFLVQIVNAADYLKDAERYLQRPRLLPAARGQILDRKGRIVAIDEPCYDLCLDYRFMTAQEGWIASGDYEHALRDTLSKPAAKWVREQQRSIARKEDKSPQEARRIFYARWQRAWRIAWDAAVTKNTDLAAAVQREVRRIRRMSHDHKRDIRELYASHPVVRGLDRTAATGIESALPETVGIDLRPSHSRRYPRGASACHVIGLTGQVDEDDVETYDPENAETNWLNWQRTRYLPGDSIGRSGVEKMCENILRGRRGFRVHRIASPGEVIEEEEPEVGRDIHLTIDIELQEALQGAFLARFPKGTGAAVVLDVAAGEILGLVSIPTFDLNTYRRDFNNLKNQTVRLPLRHRAISQCYPPGSSVKPVVALAGLTDEVIDLETEFKCINGLFELSPDGCPKCWIAKHHAGHGSVDLIEALRFSCNVYFDHVGHMLGPHRLCEWYRRFALGKEPGTGLPEESGGLVPSDDWMRRSGEKRGLMIGDAWNMAIGQGPLTASPLQVANIMATIARGGRLLSPVVSLEGGPVRIRRDIPLSDEHLAAVRQGLRDVVHHPLGTAHKYLLPERLNELGFEFCGKTGTAEVPPQRIDTDGDRRSDTEVRWGDVVWFAGFAPYQNPRIAFAVMVEYVEGGASANAAPLGLDVVRICRQFGYLP